MPATTVGGGAAARARAAPVSVPGVAGAVAGAAPEGVVGTLGCCAVVVRPMQLDRQRKEAVRRIIRRAPMQFQKVAEFLCGNKLQPETLGSVCGHCQDARPLTEVSNLRITMY